MGKIKWETMPIPKEGATFAFKARGLGFLRVIDLMESNNLSADSFEDEGKIVWLIGHNNCKDHIATYVLDDDILFTDSRESFRN